MGFKLLNKFLSRLFLEIFFNSPGPATINIWVDGRDTYWGQTNIYYLEEFNLIYPMQM